MEYSFYRNDYDQPAARLNMEAEAFGHWLNIEMSGSVAADLQKISKATERILNGSLWEFEYIGREFYLELNSLQARVSANAIVENYSDENEAHSDSDEEFSEDFDEDELHETQSGLVAHCGVEDFQQLLRAWMVFLEKG